MIFLVQYDQAGGRLIAIESYSDSEREAAEDARLALELDLNRKGITREVVLLQAPREAALRRTHARYFEELDEMISRFQSSTSASIAREREK
jgi:hypothetical protein